MTPFLHGRMNLSRSLAACLAVGLLVSSATAQTYTWDGADGGSWSVGPWSPTGNFPGLSGNAGASNGTTSDVALFTTPGTATYTVGLDYSAASLNGSLSLGALQYSLAAGSGPPVLTIGNSSAATGVLTLNGATIDTIANVVLANTSAVATTLTIAKNVGTGSGALTLSLGNANSVFLATTGNAIRVSTAIGQASGVTARAIVQGGGTVGFTGTNTFTGGVTVRGSTTLEVGADTGLGTVPGATVADSIILDGGRLGITTSFTLNARRGIALGPTTGSGSGTIDVAKGINLTYGGQFKSQGSDPASLNFTGNGGNLILTGTAPFASTVTSITVSPAIASNNANLGNALVFNPGTSVSVSDVTANLNATVAGNLRSTFRISNGKQLNWNGGITLTSSDNATFNSTNASATGFVTLSASTAAAVMNINGLISATGTGGENFQNGLWFRDGGTVNINAGLSLPKGFILVNDATRVVIMPNAANDWVRSFIGYNSLNANTLRLGGDNALPVAAGLNFGSNGQTSQGRFDMNGYNQTVGDLYNRGGGGAANQIIANDFTDPLSQSILTVAGTTSTPNSVFSGVIQDGTSGGKVGLKVTGGSLTLGGANTYTGPTTVSGGSLILTGTLGNTAVTAAGGTLAGTGTIAGTVQIAAAGTLAPGTSIGTLTSGAATFAPGGNFNWQLRDAVGIAGTGYDSLTVNGTLTITATAGEKFLVNLWTLSGTNPDVNGPAANFDNSVTQSWTLVATTGGISGFDASKFAINTGAANGTSGFSNDLSVGSFSLSLASGGNNLVLTYAPVPEPGLVLGLSALGLAGWYRRPRKAVTSFVESVRVP